MDDHGEFRAAWEDQTGIKRLTGEQERELVCREETCRDVNSSEAGQRGEEVGHSFDEQ